MRLTTAATVLAQEAGVRPPTSSKCFLYQNHAGLHGDFKEPSRMQRQKTPQKTNNGGMLTPPFPLLPYLAHCYEESQTNLSDERKKAFFSFSPVP